jgi:hypothetical protein
MVQLIVTAGARLHSFRDAAFALGLAGLSISARYVQELTQTIGAELAAQRDAQAVARRQRRLPARETPTPTVVAVEVDGGRLRTRAPHGGPGVHDAQSKEDKIACLVSLKSAEHREDPCPQPPPSFLQPRRIQRLVRQMGGQAGDELSDVEQGMQDDKEVQPAAIPRQQEEPDWAPRRAVRTCVASMETSERFGPLMAAEAQLRDFYNASRRAFVADGQAYNWTIQRGYFADFEPIVDFLHVICYVFSAAQAVAAETAAGWRLYEQWLTACWQGRVALVIAELKQHQEAVGRPPPGEELKETDARRALAEALSYLGNNESRMDYPRYRQQGLPTTSSLAESLVGEFNARVKGREKFWNRPGGAEAILQVRAALLSEDGRLERFFAARPGSVRRRRVA